MSAIVASQPVDSRWYPDGRPGGDATKAAVSLARVWRGYILCVYLDNGANSQDVWANLYDPYIHDHWFGAQRIALPGNGAPSLTSMLPPGPCYTALHLILLTAHPQQQIVCSVVDYPMQADAPEDFKKNIVARQSATGIADFDINARPSLVEFNGSLVCAYRSSSVMLKVFTGTLDAQGNTAWRGAQAPGNLAIVDGPALAVFAGQLRCAVTAVGGQIKLLSSTDGVAWSAPAATPATSIYGPALAPDPLGKQLTLLYAEGSSKLLHTTESGDAANWSTPAPCTGLTQNAPALAASAAGLLVAAYRGSDNDNVYVVTTRPGTYPLQ